MPLIDCMTRMNWPPVAFAARVPQCRGRIVRRGRACKGVKVDDVYRSVELPVPFAADAHAASSGPPPIDREHLGQVVLVCQGGGALGAYQGGVYQALAEAEIAPDWVIGTSIGAINAALIAGNKPEHRLARMTEFWSDVRQGGFAQWFGAIPFIGAAAGNAATAAIGLPGFFTPNPASWLGMHWPMGTEDAGFYDCAPLLRTLERLVDVDVLNGGGMRLTVGAANVRTGQMRYFDTRREPLSLAHVMASGALPPAFPAVRIDGASSTGTAACCPIRPSKRCSTTIRAAAAWCFRSMSGIPRVTSPTRCGR